MQSLFLQPISLSTYL